MLQPTIGSTCEVPVTDETSRSQSTLMIPSVPVGLMRFERFIMALRALWNIRGETYVRMQVAMHEAVSNAMAHGNGSDAHKHVYIRARRHKDRFTFMIMDEGDGFNHRALPDLPELTVAGRKGYGIFIARHLSDKMKYSIKGNRVWLTFQNNGPGCADVRM